MSFSAEIFDHLLVLTRLLTANLLGFPPFFFLRNVAVDPESQEKIASKWMGWVMVKNSFMEVPHHTHSCHYQIVC